MLQEIQKNEIYKNILLLRRRELNSNSSNDA